MRDRLQLHSLKWNDTCGAEPLVDMRTRGNRSNRLDRVDVSGRPEDTFDAAHQERSHFIVIRQI
jgi:hypothetical protein